MWHRSQPDGEEQAVKMRTAVKSFIRKILRVSYCGSRFCADSSTLAANKFFEIKIIAQATKNGEKTTFHTSASNTP